MEDAAKQIEEWADQYQYVGYGLIEEVAFSHHLSKTDRGGGKAPASSLLEIETFLHQMNEINKRQNAFGGEKNNPLSSITNRSVASPIAEGDDTLDNTNDVDIDYPKLQVFTSTLTSSRQVRDHNRQLKYLLDALKLPYEIFDVADNKFLQNQVVKLLRESLRNGGRANLPASVTDLEPYLDNAAALLEHSLPIVSFEQRIVGTYRDLQLLNDDKPNHESLYDALKNVGFHVKY